MLAAEADDGLALRRTGLGGQACFNSDCDAAGNKRGSAYQDGKVKTFRLRYSEALQALKDSLNMAFTSAS